VIIDDAARVADGAFTAIADCVEEAGNIYQVGLQFDQCMLHTFNACRMHMYVATSCCY
jgi:hypothetical protein